MSIYLVKQNLNRLRKNIIITVQKQYPDELHSQNTFFRVQLLE